MHSSTRSFYSQVQPRHPELDFTLELRQLHDALLFLEAELLWHFACRLQRAEEAEPKAMNDLDSTCQALFRKGCADCSAELVQLRQGLLNYAAGKPHL